MLLINARVITVTGPVIDMGFVEIQGGVISRVGSMSELSPEDIPGAEDLAGKTVLPGFIDAHTHLGLCRAGEPYSQSDINTDGERITPQRSPLSAVRIDAYFSDALRAGVTAAAVSFGSAAPMPGQISVVKTYGTSLSAMTVKKYAAQKMALGENPCRSGHTQADTAAEIRSELIRARALLERGAENRDEAAAALTPLLTKQIPAHIHVHTKEDIMTAVGLKREFGINIVLLHATEGYLMPEVLKEENIPIIYGPIINDRSKQELMNMNPACPARLSSAGILTALCTDHPETPAEYLQICAAVAVRNGMDACEAVKAITINPARILGIDSRVGSIEPGKDADLAVFDGDALDIRNKPVMVICGGERVLI